jgi:TonB family protein
MDKYPLLAEGKSPMVPKTRRISMWVNPLLLVLGLYGVSARGQELRKTIANPTPVYPQLAKRMQLAGVVKIEVVIGPDGKIKDSKVIGGHPVLVEAAMTALRDWKYEKTNSETKTQVEFNFHY